MEAYIDDMVIKSRLVEEHLADLGEIFLVLREHKLLLNASKCSFGVSLGKFLGYMICTVGLKSTLSRLRPLTVCTLLKIPKRCRN